MKQRMRSGRVLPDHYELFEEATMDNVNILETFS